MQAPQAVRILEDARDTQVLALIAGEAPGAEAGKLYVRLLPALVDWRTEQQHGAATRGLPDSQT